MATKKTKKATKPAKNRKPARAAKPKASAKPATKRAGAAKKATAAKRAAAKPARKGAKPAAKAAPIQRRDRAGHLDPKYASTLRAKSREGQRRDRDEAFVGRARSRDTLAEEMGEAWVGTATSGEDGNEDVFNQNVPEDQGGPFVVTTAGQEFAEGTDASNPRRSKREPFPRT